MNVLLKFAFFSSLALASSCSLRYGMNAQDENSVPEFVFNDVQFNRYEGGDKKISLSAKKLEQYKDGKSMYAKDMGFTLYDQDGNASNTGRCGYLSADTSAEKYTLYDDIEIQNKKDDLVVKASSLRWNGKSEQLTSARRDMVTIQKGNTVMHGSGFSASAVSRIFSFTGIVSGMADAGGSAEDSSEAAADSGLRVDGFSDDGFLYSGNEKKSGDGM